MEDSDPGVLPTTVPPMERGVGMDRQLWRGGWGQSSGMGWVGKEHVDCGEFSGKNGDVQAETWGFGAKLVVLK